MIQDSNHRSSMSMSASDWLAFQKETYNLSSAVLQEYAERHVHQYEAIETELRNIIGAIERAYHSNQWRDVVSLAFWIRDTLDQHGYGSEGLTWMRMGSQAAQKTGDVRAELEFLLAQGSVKYKQGDWEEALRLFRLAVARGEENQDAEAEYASALWEVATILLERGQLEEAAELFRRTLEIYQKRMDGRAGHVYNKLAKIATLAGDYDRAASYFRQALAIWHDYGLERLLHTSYHGFGRMESERGSFEQAQEYLECSLEQKYTLGAIPLAGHTLYELGRNAMRAGQPHKAERYFEESLKIATEFRDLRYIAYNNMQLGKLRLASDEPAHAYTHLQSAWDAATDLGIKEIHTIANLLQDVYRWKFESARSSGSRIHFSSGGVVYRDTERGPEVVLLHRADGDTWHLPKGTVENGETPEEAAVREMREETNITGRIVARLADLYSEFRDNNDEWIPKRTTYFLILAQSGELQCDLEHDKAQFVPIEDASTLLAKTFAFEYEPPVVELAHSLLTPSK
jgi:8-oxo-dGTP pyrophosphatase MutT (NUDIX family)/tetratricopeptide (TPR) repeat protein